MLGTRCMKPDESSDVTCVWKNAAWVVAICGRSPRYAPIDARRDQFDRTPGSFAHAPGMFSYGRSRYRGETVTSPTKARFKLSECVMCPREYSRAKARFIA